MVGHFWTEDEKDVFLHFIIPKSQYSTGSFDPSSGMSWKDLAPVMQEEMARLGDNRREYTEAVLSQRHYKYFSAHSVSRGEAYVPVMVAAIREPANPPPRGIRTWLPEGRVHENSMRMTAHDLVPKMTRTGGDDQEIRKFRQDIKENLGSRKRRYEDFEEDDHEFMSEADRHNSRPSRREVEGDFQNEGTRPRFVLDTLDTSDDSEPGHFQKPFRAPANETEEQVKAKLDAEEKGLRSEDEERRKRRKTGHAEVETRGNYTDIESRVIPTEPALPHPNTGAGKRTFGTFVDGIYYPANRVFSFPPRLEQSPVNLFKDFSKEVPDSSQLSSLSIHAQQNAVVAAKRKEKVEVPKPPRPLQKCTSKMTNKLLEGTSKHPIPFTARPLSLFSSVRLPKILKRPGSSKPSLHKDNAHRDQPEYDIEEEKSGLKDGAVGASTRSRSKKQLIAEDKGELVEKTFNISGTIYKLSELPQAVKRAFGIDDNGNLLAPSRSSTHDSLEAPGPSRDYKPSTTMIPKRRSMATVSFANAYMDKYSVPRSVIEVPYVETIPDDAAPWAKKIAANYGNRETVSTVVPVPVDVEAEVVDGVEETG